MSQRPNFNVVSADLSKRFLAFSQAVKQGAIEARLLHLVDIRVSQINGCAFCLDMHTKEAKIGGERELRLYHVAIWRDSPLFDARERAALEWAEALTRLPPHGVSDELYAGVRAQLSEQEISDLTFAIMAINGWNRVSIAYQAVPGALDEAYGLTKAGLS